MDKATGIICASLFATPSAAQSAESKEEESEEEGRKEKESFPQPHLFFGLKSLSCVCLSALLRARLAHMPCFAAQNAFCTSIGCAPQQQPPIGLASPQRCGASPTRIGRLAVRPVLRPRTFRQDEP